MSFDQKQIEIVGYEDRFAADFSRLNRDWLEQFGLLEGHDLEHLDTPRESIIAPGGEIMLAMEDGKVIGTAALMPAGEGVLELAKVAVAPAQQRRGIGRRLTVTAIERARARGDKKLVLVSNSKLVSAIRLYESLGFEHKPVPADVGYATANVYMELCLTHS